MSGERGGLLTNVATAALPLVIGADGIRVPFRPAAKTPRGATLWREVKVAVLARLRPGLMPPDRENAGERVSIGRLLLLASGPMLLIVAVLGSILKGIATPTEAAAVGAVGAMLLALIGRQFNLRTLKDVVYRTTRIKAMVFMILVGASLFSLVFRGLGGDEMIADFLTGGRTCRIVDTGHQRERDLARRIDIAPLAQKVGIGKTDIEISTVFGPRPAEDVEGLVRAAQRIQRDAEDVGEPCVTGSNSRHRRSSSEMQAPRYCWIFQDPRDT